MKRLTPNRQAILGLALTVIGLTGLVSSLFGEQPAAAATTNGQAAQVVQAPQAKEEVVPQSISGHPNRIEVPAVGVNMPIIDGGYDASTNEWTLTDDKAQFAAMTTEPNDKSGQTFVYGHATQRVFGKLLNMRIGQEAYVYTSNGYKFTYTLKETQVVSPSNTGILSYTGSPRLLLQTCVGALSENRKFFIFEFTKVEKI